MEILLIQWKIDSLICLACTLAKMLQCLPLVKDLTIVLHCWPTQTMMFLKIPCVTFGIKCQMMKSELKIHFALSHADQSQKVTNYCSLFTVHDYCSLLLFTTLFYAYLRGDVPYVKLRIFFRPTSLLQNFSLEFPLLPLFPYKSCNQNQFQVLYC